MDHDQRFKHLLRERFGDLLRLFPDPWADRFDVEAVEWLEQEVFADPPEGRRRVLDIVGKLPIRIPGPGQAAEAPKSWMALVHVEIESADRAAALRPRMFDAYVQLRRRYRLPVLPIALFLRTGLEGIGVDVFEEQFWELRPVRFEYLYLGLPALDAVKYVEGDNLLGVALAALMKIRKGQAAWVGAEALRRIAEARLSDERRFLLGECVQAYLPLDAGQKKEFDRLLKTPAYGKVKAMNTTWYEKGEQQGLKKGLKTGIEKGIEEGIEKGIEKGRREILLHQLVERFGPLPAKATKRLQQMSADEMVALSKALLRANSLKELGLSK